ncbi:MAG: AbrB/MazE/SpoVT family DNA-binding domain-containing protein [Coriobacteriia bacterium]|jgi:antitoxin MazE
MITRIQKWGNSQGIRIGKELLQAMTLEVGDTVEVSVGDGALVVTPARRVRGGVRLEDLVAAISPDTETVEVDWGAPSGTEVW